MESFPLCHRGVSQRTVPKARVTGTVCQGCATLAWLYFILDQIRDFSNEISKTAVKLGENLGDQDVTTERGDNGVGDLDRRNMIYSANGVEFVGWLVA